MPSFELATEIAAPPSAVWGLLCDTDAYPEWITVTQEVLSHDDGPMRQGYCYRERGGIPPFIGESHWTVTEFEPESRQVHVGNDGKVEILLDIRVEPTGAGSRLVQRLRFRPRWFLIVPFTVMWIAVMKSRGTKAIRQTQANAKAHLEESSTSQS